MLDDVPSPIDFCRMADAVAWEAAALTRRPWRVDFFARFAEAIADVGPPVQRVLELGSGPGFLAEHLLSALPIRSYLALDFSAAMHQLAAARLGALSSRVQFVQRSFRDLDWTEGLGLFDCVVTHQAVHELRHKRHASALHAQVRRCLNAGGAYLLCDHFVGDGGMTNTALYMSTDEHVQALHQAGFADVELLMLKGGLVFYQARVSHPVHSG